MANANHHSDARLPAFAHASDGLLEVSRWRLVVSLSLPFVWCEIYFVCAILGCWPAAVLSLVALSFVTYGSISHDLVHGNLGLPRRWNRLLLTAIELLALRSGHAYRAAHLHHHARFPHDDDVEGLAAGSSFGRTLLEGVVFQFRIVNWALVHAPRDRSRIVFELCVCGLAVAFAIAALPQTPIFFIYVVLMTMGTSVIPLVTSYIPHVREGADELHQTRRFRGKVASLVALEHLYHLEHHLYPGVPHHHWRALALRLDPYFDAAGVAPVKLWF